MALSESDVRRQIQHMIAYIEQEANEKAEEIETKAEEEFLIKKNKIYQARISAIRDFYDMKEKQVELQRKITFSNLVNQARLQLLKERENHIAVVIAKTRDRLARQSQSSGGAYSNLIVNLMVQAMFQLVEPVVTIRIKKSETSLINSLFSDIKTKYNREIAKDVVLKIDETYLSEDSCGGVKLCAARNRITVDNTLDARLNLIATNLQPAIRTALFGANINRKYKD